MQLLIKVHIGNMNSDVGCHNSSWETLGHGTCRTCSKSNFKSPWNILHVDVQKSLEAGATLLLDEMPRIGHLSPPRANTQLIGLGT